MENCLSPGVLTLGKAQSKEINYAMSNTFGFGGDIATVIFKKYKS